MKVKCPHCFEEFELVINPDYDPNTDKWKNIKYPHLEYEGD